MDRGRIEEQEGMEGEMFVGRIHGGMVNVCGATAFLCGRSGPTENRGNGKTVGVDGVCCATAAQLMKLRHERKNAGN